MPFTGENAGELVPQPLVLAEQEADLTPADADVAGGDVGVRPDVPEELGHEALAEAHDFHVALALRIEIGTALAAAHRERREAVLEHLLEGEELQDAEVHGRVETKTALVRSDRAVHLDPEPPVHVDLSLVIDPGNAEQNHALRLDDALEDLRFSVLGVPFENDLERFHDFLYRLMKLRLRRILRFHVRHEFSDECCHTPFLPAHEVVCP